MGLAAWHLPFAAADRDAIGIPVAVVTGQRLVVVSPARRGVAFWAAPVAHRAQPFAGPGFFAFSFTSAAGISGQAPRASLIICGGHCDSILALFATIY